VRVIIAIQRERVVRADIADFNRARKPHRASPVCPSVRANCDVMIGKMGAAHAVQGERLTGMLRGMILARAVDDRLWLLNRQGSVHFGITSAGHEATQFGCALAVHAGRDYVVPYYRDMALRMALGQSALDMLLHVPGRQGYPAGGARQMFGHFSSRTLRIVSGSSSVGSHIVHAAGLALEGAIAEGAWNEGINFAGIHQRPLVLVCENNPYAISVPLLLESPVEEIARKVAGYGMPGVSVDGNDLFAVYEAAKMAMDRARGRRSQSAGM